MAKTTKSTEKLKKAEERIVELNAKIKELTTENEVLKTQVSEATVSPEVSDQMDIAKNVRFDTEEGIYMLDTVAYSADGPATLLSSEPVAGKGFANKIEHAYRSILEHVEIDVKNRLKAEEAQRKGVK